MNITVTSEPFKSLPQGKQVKESEQASQPVPVLEQIMPTFKHVVLQRTSLPDSMLLGALRHPRLHLKTPLRITLSTENEYIIAECVELNEFGYGLHLTAALADLQHTIAELYWTLKEDQGRLGGDLPAIWAILQAKIQER